MTDSRSRTITLTLTTAQWWAVNAAIGLRELQLQEDVAIGDAKTERAVLNRAWDKLQTAWTVRTSSKRVSA